MPKWRNFAKSGHTGPCLVVLGETDDEEVVSSNPGTAYQMDHFSHLFVVKLHCYLKRPKIHGKVAEDGPMFNKNQSTIHLS